MRVPKVLRSPMRPERPGKVLRSPMRPERPGKSPDGRAPGNQLLHIAAKWSLTMSFASPSLKVSNYLRYRDMPNHASDHLSDLAELSKCVNEEVLDLREEVLSTSMFEEIVGSSEAIRGVAGQVMRVAPSGATSPC